MLGGVIGGYCATGRLTTATAPARVMTIDSTDAKIGRSMKKCENMAALQSRQGDKETRRQGDRASVAPDGDQPPVLSAWGSAFFVSLSPCLLVSLSDASD